MKIFICIVLAVAAGFGHAGDLSWNNFTDGYAKIKGQKKAGIIDFYTDWCHWCKVMDQKTFNDPEVKKKLMGRFVSIRINPNPSCPAKIERRIQHFVSRNAMNIDSLGPAIIHQLLEKKLIRDFADIYTLKKENLAELERMGEKSAQNVINGIEKS